MANLANLPVELHLQIFKDLDIASTAKIGQVCKRLYASSTCDDLWKHLATKFAKVAETNNKALHSRNIKKLSSFGKLSNIHKRHLVCRKCGEIGKKGNTTFAVQRCFGKSWCLKCSRSSTLPKTAAYKYLRNAGLRAQTVKQILDTCTSLSCYMNGTKGTYYTRELLDNYISFHVPNYKICK